jgi:hypothetical protein
MTTAIVITSINKPSPEWLTAVAHAKQLGWRVFIIGDSKSSSLMAQFGDDYYPVERQVRLLGDLAVALPLNHYSRKNIGYILAAQTGCETVVETDDDNYPSGSEFWEPRELKQLVRVPTPPDCNWINPYRAFSRVGHAFWPRGLPLEFVDLSSQFTITRSERRSHCVIQQGLADENPDVDAVYRMTQPLPIIFDVEAALVIPRGLGAPFNSQNTTFFKSAFPLLYLPSFVSFRMTDIWRSLVALRICHAYEWDVIFTRATMVQHRNEHDLKRDFDQEVPGYINNSNIWQTLCSVRVSENPSEILSDLYKCYAELVTTRIISSEELKLLQLWISAIKFTL